LAAAVVGLRIHADEEIRFACASWPFTGLAESRTIGGRIGYAFACIDVRRMPPVPVKPGQFAAAPLF